MGWFGWPPRPAVPRRPRRPRPRPTYRRARSCQRQRPSGPASRERRIRVTGDHPVPELRGRPHHRVEVLLLLPNSVGRLGLGASQPLQLPLGSSDLVLRGVQALQDVCPLSIGQRLLRRTQLVEDLLQQRRPEVGLDVLPGVELDVRDIGPDGEVGLRGLAGQLAELADPVPDLGHQEALAAAPLTEQADGQRRHQGAGRDQVREGVGLDADVDEVGCRIDHVTAERGQAGRPARKGPGQPLPQLLPRDLLLRDQFDQKGAIPIGERTHREAGSVQRALQSLPEELRLGQQRADQVGQDGRPPGGEPVRHRDDLSDLLILAERAGADGRCRLPEAVQRDLRKVVRQQITSGEPEVPDQAPHLAVRIRMSQQGPEEQVRLAHRLPRPPQRRRRLRPPQRLLERPRPPRRTPTRSLRHLPHPQLARYDAARCESRSLAGWGRSRA